MTVGEPINGVKNRDTTKESVSEHLRAALQSGDPGEKNFHIRHALQLHDKDTLAIAAEE